MSEEQVKRVALAIHEASFSELDFEQVEECRMREARAAISAMQSKEPPSHSGDNANG